MGAKIPLSDEEIKVFLFLRKFFFQKYLPQLSLIAKTTMNSNFVEINQMAVL